MLFWHMKLFLTPVVLASLLTVLSTQSLAQPDPTALDAVQFSTDIHTRLPADGGSEVILSDDAIAEVGIASGTATATEWLGRLDRSDVDAFHRAMRSVARPPGSVCRRPPRSPAP